MMDLHCHIGLYDDPMRIAKEAEDAGVITLAMTNSPSEFDRLYYDFLKFRRVRLALGLHPLEAPGHKQYYSMFRRLVDKTSFIGEVGLDFSQQGLATKNIQIESFRFVLECIHEKAKVISVHSRGAETAVLEMLIQYGAQNVIFHWYSGSMKNVGKIIEQGYYFSINNAMLRSQKGLAIIKAIPQSRILLETDGPFIKIKGHPAKPTDTKSLIPMIKDIWQISEDEVAKQLRVNFQKLIDPIKSK